MGQLVLILECLKNIFQYSKEIQTPFAQTGSLPEGTGSADEAEKLAQQLEDVRNFLEHYEEKITLLVVP